MAGSTYRMLRTFTTQHRTVETPKDQAGHRMGKKLLQNTTSSIGNLYIIV